MENKLILLLIIPMVAAVCPSPTPDGMVFCYDFEDWTGDAATTPDYFSSTSYSTYWDTHTASTEVVQSGDSNCGGKDAHTGQYYFHQGFYTDAIDPCLGEAPTSINPHTLIGLNAQYPPNPKNNLVLGDAASSNILTIRTYFRATGDWPNEGLHTGNKFLRLYSGSSANQIISLSDDGTTLDIYDHPTPTDSDVSWGDYHNLFTSPVNWADGQWHSVAAVYERFPTPRPNGDVLSVTVWIDDWDMEGDPVGSAETYDDGWQETWSYLALMVNWDAENPVSVMGIDFDDIEIWDGLPTGSSDTCADGETRSCSTGLPGICSPGTETCNDHEWGSCVQNNQATAEICGNGIDEDCSGTDLACHNSGGGKLLIDYGFEDWTGDADTTPGYFSTTDEPVYWSYQESGTEVLSNCNGRTAHSGNYFWRLNFYTGGFDDCLGSTPISENAHTNIGLGASSFPAQGGDTTTLHDDISSDTVTVRFYFRLTGDWPNPGVAGNPSMKWLRMMGEGTGDPGSGFINFLDTAEQFAILDYGNLDWDYFAVQNLDDGQWHSFNAVYQRLNDANSDPNLRIRFWVDDWDMQGSPAGSKDVYAPEYGAHFNYLAMFVNWGGTPTPSSEMAVEIDDFQLWDGIPGTGTMTLHELINIIDSWKSGQRTIQQVMEAIQTWKSG